MLRIATLGRGIAAAVVLSLACTAAASAQTWSEIGDAGNLVATAQTTAGVGAITTLTGSLSSPTDVDLYCVQIGPAPRIPNLPVASLQCVAMQGPNVWVFDANGVGIATNETCSGGGKTLTTNTVPTGGTGTFYVAVSYYGVNPLSAGGPIWLPAVAGERLPDGPGAAGSLLGWAGTPVVQPINPYQINLSYAAFCDSPTPTAPVTWGATKAMYR